MPQRIHCVKHRKLVMDFNDIFSNTIGQPTLKGPRMSPIEGGEQAQRRFSKYHFLHITFLTHHFLAKVYRESVTPEIRRHLSASTVALPSVSMLGCFLDAPLHERAKVPLAQDQFDAFIPSPLELRRDTLEQEDLEQIFRVDDQSHSDLFYTLFCPALMDSPPPDDGTKNSFISFWDINIRRILQTLIPGGKSIRGTDQISGTASQRPDFGFLYDGICVFRGEENARSDSGDPRTRLADKMVWTYDPAPYVLGEGFCIT